MRHIFHHHHHHHRFHPGPEGRRGGGSPFRRDGEPRFSERRFMRGRKLSAEGMQLLILSLIAEQPRHGYEIIRAVEELSQGLYVPSPGVIYPALSYLEDAGLAEAQTDGNRRSYSPTEAGRAHLADAQEAVEALRSAIGRAGDRFDEMRRSEGDDGRHKRPFSEMRMALRAALFDLREAPPEVQERAGEILRRTVAELRGLQGKD
ncbi:MULTISPECIES: PadR family transcriptional regulator [unclassified Haematobacter]|uniref:PadR family transcriptional regulator n=1 Tax=unclassified Haematobacter TaxID=2640585 RepID=UPI0025C07500|nr:MULTISPECIES: PadR family transcriptional regulator [unclassified Haematobacter]